MNKNKKEKTEYISLFEAAKKSGYAQDYLSLLCRQGKLKGEKIGRNWVTTYQWLDEYQRNLISDMVSEKKFIASKKDFKEIKNIERIIGRKNDIFKRIKIPHKRTELVLATSLFFLILIGGFSYAKNPQLFSNIQKQAYKAKNEIAYRLSEISGTKTSSVGDFKHSVSVAKDQIAYRMSEMKNNVFNARHWLHNGSSPVDLLMKEEKGNRILAPQPFGTMEPAKALSSVSKIALKISDNASRNIYSRIDAGKFIAMIPLQIGEKFGEGIIAGPMKIGDGIDKGFEKSDLVLNSSLRKTHLAVQDSFNGISDEIAALLPSARNDRLSKSEDDNIYCRLQDSFDNLQLPKLNFGRFSLAIQNTANNFSKGVLTFFEAADKTVQEEFKTPSSEDFRHSVSKISPRVAGVSDSAEENTEVNLLQNLRKFNFRIVVGLQSFKKNIRLALDDVKDVFEKGIILCKTTLTIQRDGVSQTPSVGDSGHSVSKVAGNQNQEAIQISSKELSEDADDQTKDGLIVLPSPESEKEKEKLKEKIELSFSDEVEIKPEDATSGIITPVFRKTKGDDYLYLMVPMKDSEARK